MILAECPAIPGRVSQGTPGQGALANIREAIEACLEAHATHSTYRVEEPTYASNWQGVGHMK